MKNLLIPKITISTESKGKVAMENSIILWMVSQDALNKLIILSKNVNTNLDRHCKYCEAAYINWVNEYAKHKQIHHRKFCPDAFNKHMVNVNLYLQQRRN